MTWDAYNRRRAALREVLAIADRRREEATAAELIAEVESAHLAFESEADLLLDVQMSWYQALSGRMDQMLTLGAPNLETGAIETWHHVAHSMPGARALLDANDNLEDLQVAFSKEHEFLGRAAGVPANHRDLCGLGERILRKARATLVPEPYAAPREGSLMTRLRGLRAA